MEPIKKDVMMSELVLDTTMLALSALEPPPMMVLSGRKLTAPMFFSEAVAEPILYWSASSLARQLHDASIFNVSIVADLEMMSGARIEQFDRRHNLLGFGNESSLVGSTPALLLLAEAAEQLMMPARKGLAYDYEELILSFKSAVRAGYKPKDTLSDSDFILNKTLYMSLRRSYSANPGSNLIRGRDE